MFRRRLVVGLALENRRAMEVATLISHPISRRRTGTHRTRSILRTIASRPPLHYPAILKGLGPGSWQRRRCFQACPLFTPHLSARAAVPI